MNHLRSFYRLARAAVAAAALLPALTVLASQVSFGGGFDARFLVQLALALGGGALLFGAVEAWFRIRRPWLAETEALQEAALDAFAARLPRLAIIVAAASSLLFELTVIRWQGSVFKFFDIYKNIGLLSCFAGLGLGYALAGRRQAPLLLVPLFFLLQIGLLLVLKHGLGWRADVFLANPVREQLQMGLPQARDLSQYAAVYSFMALVFLLTALTFVPVGQLCGRVMRPLAPLAAYGLNLLGSVAGVLLTFLLAALWTPPAVWFALVFLLLLPFAALAGRGAGLAAGAALAAIALLSLPLPVGFEKIHSPYQLIERGPSRAASMAGLSTLTVSGKYFQRILDLSPQRQSIAPEARQMAHHYDLPYRVGAPPRRVAVLGAGTGNDVAAALRAGAERVDAIEIDPAILHFGRLYHPEQPYQDPRVRAEVDDARTYLRRTSATYDRIVYGLLDAQTLLSHGSSVRLDSFVYTVEALAEARQRLADGGLLCLSFAVCSDGQGRKIHRMLEAAFDGRAPASVVTDIGDVTFVIGRDGNPDLSALDLAAMGFKESTARFADPAIQAEVSTDDWPFLYMQQRVYPLSYLAMLVVIPLLSLLLIGGSLRGDGREGGARFGHPAFLLLGAGFMLVETKGITELGLTFGNTWQVIGVVIVGVLAMAYLANLAVLKLGCSRLPLPYLLLFLALAAGWLVARSGGLPSTVLGRLGTVALLTCPLFFSGLVFSSLIRRTGDVPAAMAMNLLGAMLGGLLEYNSMYFGFRFLYLLGIALYALAAASTWLRPLRAPAA